MKILSWPSLALVGGAIVVLSVAVPGSRTNSDSPPEAQPSASLEVSFDESGELIAWVEVSPGASVRQVAVWSDDPEVRFDTPTPEGLEGLWMSVSDPVEGGCHPVSAEVLLDVAIGGVTPTTTVKSSKKASHKSSDKASKKASHKSSDKASKKASHKSSGKSSGKSSHKASHKSSGKSRHKASHKSSHKTSRKASHKSSGKSSGKSQPTSTGAVGSMSLVLSTTVCTPGGIDPEDLEALCFPE